MPFRVAFQLAIAASLALMVAGSALAWDVVLTNVVREAPECVSWSAGRLDCFARGANGRLSWIVYTKGKWSAPQDLGGDLPMSVSCVVRGPGGINCFAPTAKGVLAEIHLNGAKWSSWTSLGGELAVGHASCLALGRDHIACYARGRRGQLMSRSWDGGAAWKPWRDLGGSLSGDPTCVALSGVRVACFGRAPNGQLVGYLPDETGGSGAWVAYGGQVEGRASCAALTATEVACAVRGADRRMYMLRTSSIPGRSHGRLVASGDQVTGDPACFLGGGSFTCFAPDSGRHLLRRTVAANGDMSEGRQLPDSPRSMSALCREIQNGALGCLVADTQGRLQFAMGGELAGSQAAESDVGVDDSPQGDWYLSSLETNVSCRVRLHTDEEEGENQIELERDCDALPGIMRADHWETDDDQLEFVTRRGRRVVRFRLTGSGRWISPMPRMPYMLSRDRPDSAGETEGETPAPGLRFEEGDARGVFGQWRLNAEEGGNCGVRLTDWPAGGGNAVVLQGTCPDAMRVVQFWSLDGNAVVLVTGDGRIVARFKRRSPNAWEGETPQGLRGLTLTR
jgi:hypothetical protein